MDSAKPRELRILETGNSAEDAHLLAVLQLGLEADHVPQSAERIVLTELDDGIGPAPGPRIVESDALHRAEAQRLDAAIRHHLDRHAALEIRRVLLPVLELGLLAVAKRLNECFVLIPVERAIDVVFPTLVPASG